MTETTRWIELEERLSKDDVQAKAVAWISRMNQNIEGHYRLLECTGWSDLEKARFQVLQSVPRRKEQQRPICGPVTETLRWIPVGEELCEDEIQAEAVRWIGHMNKTVNAHYKLLECREGNRG